jgi:hypothetical protein
VERARGLIKPYTKMDGVIGVYVVGSATRPFRDSLSDYDFEVVMEDEAFSRVPADKKLAFVIEEGPPRRVDHEFYLRPWKELESLVRSTLDLDHYPFQYAKVLHDQSGRLAGLVERLAILPDPVRTTRMKVHYLEFRFGASRASKCLDRCGTLNANLVLGEAIAALVKLLFLVKRSWPSTRHWSEEELELLGVGPDLLAAIGAALSSPEKTRLQALAKEVDRLLEGQGETFHRNAQRLMQWAYLTDAGKRAFRRFGAR